MVNTISFSTRTVIQRVILKTDVMFVTNFSFLEGNDERFERGCK